MGSGRALRQLDRFRKDIFTEFFARSQASQDLFKQPLGTRIGAGDLQDVLGRFVHESI